MADDADADADPARALRAPIYQTSTFVFRSAAEAEALYAGRAERAADFTYTRLDNPNQRSLEASLAELEGAEAGLVFASGLAAVTTSLLALVRAGVSVLHSTPLHGGPETFLRERLPALGVRTFAFAASDGEERVWAAADEAVSAGPVAAIYVETPANPTGALVDLAMCARVRDRLAGTTGARPVLLCDTTLLGPVGQRVLGHGVDVAVYSLTKHVGGHSDVIAGAVMGSRATLAPIRALRNLLGPTLDPHACWLLTRSLDTLTLRMEAAFANAAAAAEFLNAQPKATRVRHPTLTPRGSRERAIFERQCLAGGATFAFDVIGGKAAAFRFLDALRLVRHAVSLGGTESLACHPATTTHVGVPADVRAAAGIGAGTIRLSTGIEPAAALIADLEQALEAV